MGEDVPTAAEQMGSLSTALKLWMEAPNPTPQFAFPLEYEYTEGNLSFDNLKGRDAQIVSLLTAQRDVGSGEPLLDVTLCLIERHEIGRPEYRHGCDDYEWW